MAARTWTGLRVGYDRTTSVGKIPSANASRITDTGTRVPLAQSSPPWMVGCAARWRVQSRGIDWTVPQSGADPNSQGIRFLALTRMRGRGPALTRDTEHRYADGSWGTVCSAAPGHLRWEPSEACGAGVRSPGSLRSRSSSADRRACRLLKVSTCRRATPCTLALRTGGRRGAMVRSLRAGTRSSICSSRSPPFRGAASVVRLAFAGRAARLVTERTWHASQTVARRPDGRVELTMRVPLSPGLRGWILSWVPELKCWSRRNWRGRSWRRSRWGSWGFGVETRDGV